MKKILFLFLFFPFIVLAQTDNVPADTFFRAEVVEVTKQQETVLDDGASAEQQNLLLKGLEGDYKDKNIEFDGIGEVNVLNKNIYGVGDKVLVVASYDADGKPHFYVTDYVRTKTLWWLVVIFFLSLIVVGRWKGLRSVFSLALTFFVLVKYIVPQILSGASPVIVTIFGSLVILLAIIYITEGWCARSHLAAVSIFFSLALTIALSWFFVTSAKLTGAAGEDISFLLNVGEQIIDFRGLLLAGIIIGALGVLDDVVISQVATVEQIARADRSFNGREIFKRAYRVGVSHIASMTNTLFLAYAGASLPLLILFVSGESAFTGWGQAVNSEIIATEIIRTLSGSIGLILSVPIATLMAAWWYCHRRD